VNDLALVWIIVGVLLLAGLVTAGTTTVRRRRRGAPGPTVPRGSTTTAPGEAPSDVLVEEGAPPVALEPDTAAAPTLERPEPVGGRLVRLRERLARSGSPLGARLLSVLSRDHLTEDDWDELEETLLLADVGAGPAAELIDALRTRVRVLGVRDAQSVRDLLREELVALVDPSLDRSLATTPSVGEA
jgi:fused signal recognition particle receptor